MINLLDITSRIHIITMFVIVDYKKHFIQNLQFTTYSHIQFHILSSNISLVITINLKAKYTAYAACMFLFQIIN
jgi:hypothetical protein